MGCVFHKMSVPIASMSKITDFKFHDQFAEDSENGLFLHDVYLPEEIINLILSYIDPKELLSHSLVCKKWCNVIKSHALWSTVYSRKYKKRAKILPWYLYYSFFTSKFFNNNLLKNNCGQNMLDYWKIQKNYGDEFKVESIPIGCDPLPADIPDFNGATSCFVTSFYECNKMQFISFVESNLVTLIINTYKPHIHVSEWIAGRFDCGCIYRLKCKLHDYKFNLEETDEEGTQMWSRYPMNQTVDSSDLNPKQPGVLAIEHREVRFHANEGIHWTKVELVFKDYPEGVIGLCFEHEGHDTQFWKGHYGSKMTGGVVKIDFDSIQSDVKFDETHSLNDEFIY